jgi:uroporphyrinogen-III synthase
VGPATAHAIREQGWTVHKTARVFNTRGVLSALGSVRGKKILLPRVQNGPRDLPEALRRRGAIVDEVATYETVAAPPPPGFIKKMILNNADVVTFTSASTVLFFSSFFTKKEFNALFRRAIALSIGPSTTAALKQRRAHRIIEANVSTTPKMVERLCRITA